MTITQLSRTRSFPDEEARLSSFKNALDIVHERVVADMGEVDLAHIRRVHRFSRGMEVTGRVMLHFSFEPIAWSVGVVALWVHKQLQATEIGHTVLHGAYDRIAGEHAFKSKTWNWQIPIDEEAWHAGHNVRHHQYTNIVGKDPDVRFGYTRLNAEVEWERHHGSQHIHTAGAWFGFAFFMNAHFTGLVDIWSGRESYDFVDPKDPTARKEAYRKAFRKWGPYYGKEFVLFPALAGPFWWKVALGNFASEIMRDLYSAVTIFCGHIGEDVVAYPQGTRAGGRARWYAMQVESANNFEVPYLVSLLCGGLDRQIEHHLFPKLPTNRLREIAPQVREICRQHGVQYKTDTWGGTLKKVVRELWRLRSRDAKATSRGSLQPRRSPVAAAA